MRIHMLSWIGCKTLYIPANVSIHVPVSGITPLRKEGSCQKKTVKYPQKRLSGNIYSFKVVSPKLYQL